MLVDHSAHAAARDAAEMLRAGESLTDVWRYAIIQLLDDYESRRRHEGQAAAAELFSAEPPRTGDGRVDAAFAALAEHLARRDGWPVPKWATADSRYTPDWWFVTDFVGFDPLALRESPLSFRKRGIFVTADAFERL